MLSTMGATVLISTVNHRRIGSARAWLEARKPAEEVLIVGATLDAANELARGVAKDRGAAIGWHRLTLSQLAAAVARPALAGRGLVPVSRIGTHAIAARLLHRLQEQNELGRYDGIAGTPGFPLAVAGVITELRLARLSRDEVGAMAPELVPLLSAYESELSEAGLTDWSGVLELAAEAASGSKPDRLIGLPTLLLDVRVGSEAELDFVQAIAEKAPEICATAPAADEAGLGRMRRGLNPRIENLDEAAAENGTLANLQRHLFSDKPSATSSADDGAVEVFSAPGENRECVEIARRVLSLARNGAPFDRMAVFLRSPELYRANLKEAFNRAGIPAHFVRGAIRPDPAGRALCALLKCAAEGLSARRFAEYLSLGQVPDAGPDGKPPEPAPRADRWTPLDSELGGPVGAGSEDERDSVEDVQVARARSEEGPVKDGQLRAPRRWERLLVDAAVIGGRDRWRRRLEGLANELRLRLEGADEAETESVLRVLDDLAAFTGYVLPLIEILDGLPSTANWGEWLDHLGALATQALQDPERVLALLAELAPMGPVGPVTLSEVLAVMERLLLEVAVAPSRQRYGKVFVGPMEAARGLSFDAVFVLGVAERMFPRKIVEEPILLDGVRKRISNRLQTNQSRLGDERLAMALAVGAAERRICFSYPRLDLDQARPRVPSFYALEALRAAEGVLPDFAALARRAEIATNARLGWPAPPDVADAIDDAEYDLALLEELSTRAGESTGAARYLVTVNRHLARALRNRYQRWSRSWTSADGLLSQSQAVQAVMAAHRLGARSYSPTALQDYARCPYRFFLRAIHGLAPREVPEAIDELDPLQRGSLFHDVQFELFARLRQQGLLPVRSNNVEQAWRQLEAVLLDVATRYREDLAPAIERVWEDGISSIRADLREWLRRASEDDSGFVPWRFELSFGLARRPERRHKDPDSVPLAVALDCGIQLRGSIDLVERHPSGTARVTDHKSGKVQGKKDEVVRGGKSLQPLLYALAAEKLFAGEVRVTSGQLYFCTANGSFAVREVHLNDRARAMAIQIADAISEALSGPFLPAAPEKNGCNLCDYRIVCGPYEERRSAGKPQARVEALQVLRGLP
jgi:ATP-dependent helicase/nuclease subunit B